jgi:BolA family transcriptional regulator, general stress-responsive regulator
MAALGPVGQTIERKLTAAFTPIRLDIVDESQLHAGHSGAHPTGESHFRVRIASDMFAGLSRVAQHRLVNETLRDELKGRVHALAIETSAG